MSRVKKVPRSEAGSSDGNNLAGGPRFTPPVAFDPTSKCYPFTPEHEKELREEIVKEARTWIGTPYEQLGDIKGAGIDCSMLLVRCWVDTGMVHPFDPRPYPPNWHMHHSEERYLAWTNTLAQEISREQVQLADLILFQFGRCFSHAAIVTSINKNGTMDVVHAHTAIGRCTESSDQLAILAHFGKSEGCKARPRKYYSPFLRFKEFEQAGKRAT